MEQKTHRGTMASNFRDNGFAFIAPVGGGKDIFVHITALAGPEPFKGAAVQFELGTNNKGIVAINVRPSTRSS